MAVSRPAKASRGKAGVCVMFDLESTGLGTRTAQIVQIAALPLLEGGLQEQQSFNRFLLPSVAIHSGASRVHGMLVREGRLVRGVGIDRCSILFLLLLIGHLFPLFLLLILVLHLLILPEVRQGVDLEACEDHRAVLEQFLAWCCRLLERHGQVVLVAHNGARVRGEEASQHCTMGKSCVIL